MPITIASWNINSVRLRLDLVERLIDDRNPDVICLQETKCPDAYFPTAAFERRGYRHVALHGQKGYHGVAVLSRIPFTAERRRGFCNIVDSRHIAVDLDLPGGPLCVHNFYVPAGGDEPDPDKNPKFRHKLDFLEEMIGWFREAPDEIGHEGRAVLVGDLNVAPLEEDVWSHKQLLKVVSHTPVETEGLTRVQNEIGWVDVMRQKVPPPEKLFTWWSYRNRDWEKSDRGRRLDHIWASPSLAPSCARIEVMREARNWPRPSDHVPLLATFDV